jgi:Asp-tRNA(Asn)/Glu-tRNA(Gln) amidotransferase A subunit family amidase
MLISLARGVATSSGGATRLVEESLERISDSLALNAVVGLRATAALDEARLLDRMVDRGEPIGPLGGLPVLVKDVEDVEGLPTTFGSLLYANAPVASQHGLMASRLKALGAVILGKSNTPEFAAEGYTAKRVFGVTRNPWASDLSPGGSSGGSAAALAAGLTPIVTGTDIGGSVRIPAALCGVVGMKPTNGLIGRDPVLPAVELNNHGLFGVTVDDVRQQLALLSGFTPGDVGSYPSLSSHPDGILRVFAAYRMSPGDGPSGEVKRLFDDVITQIQDGMTVAVDWVEPEAIFPDGYRTEDLGCIVGAEHVHELGRDRIEQNKELLDPVIRGYLESALRTTLPEYLAARRRRSSYTLQFDRFIGRNSLLLTPTLTVDGWLADGRLDALSTPGLPSAVYNTEPPNLTGHPAISLPGGRHANGVPFGFQVIGPRYSDELVLDFAAAWEHIRPWPATAEGYSPFA